MWDADHWGEASAIDPDGHPVIRVNSTTGKREVIIVHELFHLKLDTMGFPTIQLAPSNPADPWNARYVQWLDTWLSTFASSFEHWIFFPEMRRMGLDPGMDLKNEFVQSIESGRFPHTDQNSNMSIMATLHCFRAMIECAPDKDLLKRIKRWYRESGWSGEFDRANVLANTSFALDHLEGDTPRKRVVITVTPPAQ
jgi:hypothetical protein